MTGLEILGVVALVVLVACGAVLAAAETSLTHMRRARAAVLAEGPRENGNGNGDHDGEHDRSRVLVEVLQERSRHLGPVLLLLPVCHLGAAALTTVLALRWFGPAWVAPALVLLLVPVSTHIIDAPCGSVLVPTKVHYSDGGELVFANTPPCHDARMARLPISVGVGVVGLIVVGSSLVMRRRRD